MCNSGSRADPTRLRIADIAECSADKLSRSVRYRLRREHGISSGIQVLLSLEKPRVKLIQTENPLDYQVTQSHGPNVCCQVLCVHTLAQIGMQSRKTGMRASYQQAYVCLHGSLIRFHIIQNCVLDRLSRPSQVRTGAFNYLQPVGSCAKLNHLHGSAVPDIAQQ